MNSKDEGMSTRVAPVGEAFRKFKKTKGIFPAERRTTQKLWSHSPQ